MDNLTHSLVGLTAAKAGLERLSPGASLVCVLAANSPDADIVVLAFGDRWDFLQHHRGITHAIVGVVILALLLPLIFSGVDRLWARLRHQGLRSSKERVRRLMRENGLSAATRGGSPRGPRTHDGTIIPDRPDAMWGIDATAGWTEEGPATVFIAVDHFTAECVGIHAALRDAHRAITANGKAGVLFPFGDVELGGKQIRKGQAVIAVMAAGNRDPERFPEPDRLGIERPDNRHLAFGWASHFCFGAPLARLEAEISFTSLLHRLPELQLVDQPAVASASVHVQ